MLLQSTLPFALAGVSLDSFTGPLALVSSLVKLLHVTCSTCAECRVPCAVCHVPCTTQAHAEKNK